MKIQHVYNFTTTDVTRHIVIDRSVAIEDFVTRTISTLLDIEVSKSKALGSGFGSLSFNQKIQLIKDIVGPGTLDSKKIDVFGQIRNKFAHEINVETWEQLFSLSKDFASIGNKLTSWYDNDSLREFNSEDRYKALYFYLIDDIFDFLVKIIKESIYKKGSMNAELQVKTELFEIVKEKKSHSEVFKEVGDQMFNQAFEKLEKPNTDV